MFLKMDPENLVSAQHGWQGVTQAPKVISWDANCGSSTPASVAAVFASHDAYECNFVESKTAEGDTVGETEGVKEGDGVLVEENEFEGVTEGVAVRLGDDEGKESRHLCKRAVASVCLQFSS